MGSTTSKEETERKDRLKNFEKALKARKQIRRVTDELKDLQTQNIFRNEATINLNKFSDLLIECTTSSREIEDTWRGLLKKILIFNDKMEMFNDNLKNKECWSGPDDFQIKEEYTANFRQRFNELKEETTDYSNDIKRQQKNISILEKSLNDLKPILIDLEISRDRTEEERKEREAPYNKWQLRTLIPAVLLGGGTFGAWLRATITGLVTIEIATGILIITATTVIVIEVCKTNNGEIMVRKTKEIKLTHWINTSTKFVDTHTILLESLRDELTDYKILIEKFELKQPIIERPHWDIPFKRWKSLNEYAKTAQTLN